MYLYFGARRDKSIRKYSILEEEEEASVEYNIKPVRVLILNSYYKGQLEDKCSP